MSLPTEPESSSNHPFNSTQLVVSPPLATWFQGLLILDGLPVGAATWALRTRSGQTVLRGWANSETGKTSLQPPGFEAFLTLEIRSRSSRWCLLVPPPA